MIRRLYYTDDKEQLFQHYLNAHKLLWPEDDQHRWFIMGLRSLVFHKVSVFMGCASSGKTYIMAIHALIDFFVFPRNSLSLISSTERRSLEIKVFGRVKSLFNRAKRRFDFIEGYVLESIMAITPDDVDDENEFARELTRGLICVPCVSGGRFVGMGKFQGVKPPNSPGKSDGILKHYGDECFPLGTLIDTPTGKRRVQDIKVGDFVNSALGENRVRAIVSKFSPTLARIHLSNGEHIDCTENHPLLTNMGWRKAIDLSEKDVLISRDEAMFILQKGFRSKRFARNFLFKKLRREVEFSPARNYDEAGSNASFPKIRNWEGNKCWPEIQSKSNAPRESIGEKIWPNGKMEALPHNPKNSSGKCLVGCFSEFHSQLQSKNWRKLKASTPPCLSFGFGLARYKIECGSRWGFTQHIATAKKGSGSNKFFKKIRVESVEILKPEGDLRYSECENGYRVFNFSIEGHPSYSVNGFLVHNCAVMQSSFLDAYTNWTVSEGFKGCMSGNPTDISDPLCVASEPEDGWDSYVDNQKTQEWTSKWYHAHVVAFDGRDTPNNDSEKQYDFLVSKRFVDQLEKTHGSDSWQLYQQGIGKPSQGMVSNRVITTGFCEKHKAFDKVVWRSTPILKIGALDPAYGGGDRCVWLEGNIGFDMEGRQIITPGVPETVPIRLNYHQDAEEQIADFVKTKSGYGIPPENIFYDSFGRGTLGFAFAKVFGSNCPVPVDSGARPTSRPVRFDLYVHEKTGKRLVRCDEYYSKFVTEMWFSTREAIHSEQVRELKRIIAEEGQKRMYSVVSGNRVEVESKEDMKERIKQSPDLYDTFAVLIEGARQRGFRITRIGAEVDTPATDKFAWFKDRQRLLREKRSVYSLNHSA